MTGQPRTPARERAVGTNGITLAVTEYGEAGPPLVLIHGIGSRSVSWWPVVDALAARFRLFALDLRGHGASDKPERGYLLPDYGADLAGALDDLGLDRPLILGHSLGGLVALNWAVDHPARAAAIALEDTALRSQPEVLRAFDGWLALNAMGIEEATAYFRGEHPDWTEEDCRRRAESIIGTARGVFAELRDDAEENIATGRDRLGPLAAIRSPVLLVHGDPAAGSMVVPADAARLAATLPDARLARVPGAGHGIHRDNTVAFLAAVVPFLAEAGG
jgi:pimeloyl-ACP methyl ester carboxylesterase